jgi:restriction system protein
VARRSKKGSVLDMVINEDWTFSALLSIALCYIVFFVIPTITNLMLKPMALAFRSLGLFLSVIFGAISLVKLLRQKSISKSTAQIKLLGDLKNDLEASFLPTIQDISFYEYNKVVLKTVIKPRPVEQVNTPKERPTTWTLELIKDIEWKKFEELCTAFFLEKGIRAKATFLGADGGIDIKLYQADLRTPTSIVQCKAWNSWKVGVQQIREFLGVMTHEKIAKGFYMTSGEYSEEAKKTANANRITLINGEMLLAMIKRLPSESQKNLLVLATKGDYTTPTCPSCGIKMLRRSGKRGDFWGCKNFPRCHNRLHVNPAN